MNEINEYQKLTQEIANHQEYSIRVMIYTMMLVGGVIGVKSKPDMLLVVGVSIVLFASLVYLIGAARKIFTIGAYITVFHEEGTGRLWEKRITLFASKFKLWYETKIIAVIYFVVSIGFIWFFFPIREWFVMTVFVILLLLCIMLFRIPNKKNDYIEKWEEIKRSEVSSD